jgi:predicted ArsR family transcriptional regulator
MEIESGSLEERILKILLSRYPITLKELQKELRISLPILKRALTRLQLMGALNLEILPDEIFIRLLRTDFSFHGVSKKQKKAFKKRRGKTKRVEVGEERPVYIG